VDQSTDTAAGDRIDPEFAALPLRELAAAALQRAADLGAQHADFRAELLRGQRIRLSDGQLETLLDTDTLGLAVRVVVDGTWGSPRPWISPRRPPPAPRSRRSTWPGWPRRSRRSGSSSPTSRGTARSPGFSSYQTDPFDVSVSDKIALLGQWSQDLLGHDGIDHVDAGLHAVKECKFYSDGMTTAIQQRVRVNPGLTAVAVSPDGRFETMRTLAPRPRAAMST